MKMTLNKFESKKQIFNNYSIRFSRIDSDNNIMVNKIEFFEKISGIRLFEIKMDLKDTIALYKLLNNLLSIRCFSFDMHSYNTIEKCKLKCSMIESKGWPSMVHLEFIFNNISNMISEYKILFNLEEYNMFCYYFFFYLLIDLIDEIEMEQRYG